jgi:hypothetical protein
MAIRNEPEQALGGFGSAYYQHAVEIEVYIEEGDAAARDASFDALLQQIGVALEADPTLGGLAFGLTYGRPEPVIEAIAGAPAIKSATLTTATWSAAATLIWPRPVSIALRSATTSPSRSTISTSSASPTPARSTRRRSGPACSTARTCTSSCWSSTIPTPTAS